MLQPLFDYLRSITGPTFPTGLLVIYGLGLFLKNDPLAPLVLVAAVGWSYLEASVRAYRSIGTPAGQMHAFKYWTLFVAWLGMCWLAT